MRRSHVFAVLALCLAGSGCGGDSDTLAPPDRQFIETVVALRKAAAASGGDAASYAALKAGVLRDQGRLAAVWESINVRLSAPVPQAE